jgi:polyhydroxyalkanoate synthesis regulator phasin
MKFNNAQEVADNVLEQFREDGQDPEATIDHHESYMTAETGSRLAYLTALRAWREDVTSRLDELEERLGKLETP